MLNNTDIKEVINAARSQDAHRQIIFAHNIKVKKYPKFSLSSNIRSLRAHARKTKNIHYVEFIQKAGNRVNFTNAHFLLSAYKPAGFENLEAGLYDHKLNKTEIFRRYPDLNDWLNSYILRIDSTKYNYEIINNQFFLSALNTLKNYKFNDEIVSVNIAGAFYDLKAFIGISNLVLNRPNVDINLRILNNKYLLLFNHSKGTIYDATALMPLMVGDALENNLQVNFSAFLLNMPDEIIEYPLIN